MSRWSAVRGIEACAVVALLLGVVVSCGDDSSAPRQSATTMSAAAKRAQATAAAVDQRQADRRRLARALADQRHEAALRRKDRRLFVMSDSVMLGAKYDLPKALPTWKVNLDGKESRFFKAGLEVLQARRREIGRVVVIQMGNNYGGSAAVFRLQIDAAMNILKGVRWVVFVTVFEYRRKQAEVNSELRAAALRYPNIRIADWNAYEHANPGHTSRNGLHLKPSGAVLMAGFIASVVSSLPA